MRSRALAAYYSALLFSIMNSVRILFRNVREMYIMINVRDLLICFVLIAYLNYHKLINKQIVQ